MKELLQLETHLAETIDLLSQKNWLQILPVDSLIDANTRIEQVKIHLFDAVSYTDDVIQAIQYTINQQPNVRDNQQKSKNQHSVEPCTGNLLKQRLKALYLVADGKIVDDVVKYMDMHIDEYRQQIAKLIFTNHQLKKAVKEAHRS